MNMILALAIMDMEWARSQGGYSLERLKVLYDYLVWAIISHELGLNSA